MIKKLILKDFRNFEKKDFEFSDKTTVIIGENAKGKTNILESIFLLATGKSFRARVEEEMVGYDAEVARVSGIVDSGSWVVDSEKTEIVKSQDTNHQPPTTKLEVVLTRGKIKIGDDKYEKVPKKKLLVNSISKRLFNFAGNLKVVLFGPWDMDLVTESPSIRRKFLDTVLGQVDREYRRASLSYEKGLKQRNKLLFRIREEGLSRSSLMFWDQLLIKNGNYISDKRREFIEFVNSTEDPQGQDFSLIYDSSEISEGRLDKYKNEEVSAGTTLVGPHRDDFQFSITNKELSKKRKRDLARYGSRGEQRMGVLWLKLAELSFIKEKTEEIPTLLLDDIFSELDHLHRNIVIDIAKGQQTIITTADEHFLEGIKEKHLIKL